MNINFKMKWIKTHFKNKLLMKNNVKKLFVFHEKVHDFLEVEISNWVALHWHIFNLNLL